MSSRIASKTTLNCASYFLSRAASLRASSSFEASNRRKRTKARMISMLNLDGALAPKDSGEHSHALRR